MAKGVYIGVEKKPTLMLLHGDDLTESANNLPVTNNSVTVVDDSGAFGGKALNFSGLGQYLSIADDTLSLPDDFTIDFRLYNAGSTSWRGIFETAGATSSNWTFHKGGLNISLGDGSNLLFAGIAKGGGTYSTLQTPANSVPVGTWSHIALVRSNGVITFYINGVSSASLSDSEAVTTDGTILIGKHDIRDEMYLNGKIDEFRVSSVARWTSNFTPPTEAYSNDEAGVGIARKVKKMYYGVGNLAKEIKKGYIGIGGVARPFWTSGPGEPMYYGKISDGFGSLSPALGFNSNYAVFVGGRSGNYFTNTIYAFSTDLILSSLTYPFSIYGASGNNFQNYAMIAGGEEYDRITGGARENAYRVFTYDLDLVRVERPRLIENSDEYLGFDDYSYGSSVQFNDYIFYTSGKIIEKNYSTVTVYDKSFILKNIGTIPGRHYPSASSNSGYVFFIGGKSNDQLSSSSLRDVILYNDEFVRTSTNLSTASSHGHGITIGKYACRFGSRNQSGSETNSIDAFDENAIRTSPAIMDYSSEYPYVGTFKGEMFLKGDGIIVWYDSDFIKTTYNYSSSDGVENSIDAGLYSNISEYTLVPIGDYLLFGCPYGLLYSQYHAFKFS